MVFIKTIFAFNQINFYALDFCWFGKDTQNIETVESTFLSSLSNKSWQPTVTGFKTNPFTVWIHQSLIKYVYIVIKFIFNVNYFYRLVLVMEIQYEIRTILFCDQTSNFYVFIKILYYMFITKFFLLYMTNVVFTATNFNFSRSNSLLLSLIYKCNLIYKFLLLIPFNKNEFLFLLFMSL
jgi:hypothetical protein